MRVRMVLEEKKIPYTVIEEDLSNPSETLLRLHPQGLVPLLIHAGQVIYESAIINEYLDEVFTDHRLNVCTPTERAQMRLWTHWCNDIFKADVDLLKYQFNDLDDLKKSMLVIRLKEHLAKINFSLKDREFLMGETVSLADIHVFPFVRQLVRIKSEFISLSEYPKVMTWLERICQRPSFERVMAKPAKV